MSVSLVLDVGGWSASHSNHSNSSSKSPAHYTAHSIDPQGQPALKYFQPKHKTFYSLLQSQLHTINISSQWSAPTLCDHAKHHDSGLHSLQKHHVTCTTVNSCYNTPNPHAAATPSARLATTATSADWQYAPSTTHNRPTQVRIKPDSWYSTSPEHLIMFTDLSLNPQPSDILQQYSTTL